MTHPERPLHAHGTLVTGWARQAGGFWRPKKPLPSGQIMTSSCIRFACFFYVLKTALTLDTAIVTTFVGGGVGVSVDGIGTAASFSTPTTVALDLNGGLFVGENDIYRIRKVTPTGIVTTLAERNSASFADGTGSNAGFDHASVGAVDPAGNLYVADHGNNRIRKVTPAGVVTTLAGSGTADCSDGTGTSASFWGPFGVALDAAAGKLYVTDETGHRVRIVDTATGVVSTLAGSGVAAYSDGTGTFASFHAPLGVAVDTMGNIYVADYVNSRIRKISPAGVVTTLAGSGAWAYTDGAGTLASFNRPVGIAIDATGNLYIGYLWSARGSLRPQVGG